MRTRRLRVAPLRRRADRDAQPQDDERERHSNAQKPAAVSSCGHDSAPLRDGSGSGPARHDASRASRGDAVVRNATALAPTRERELGADGALYGSTRRREVPPEAEGHYGQLEARLGTRVPWLMLHADVCRRELLVEIEGMHGVGA